MSWLDSIKGALVEEDPKPTATSVVTAMPSPAPVAGASSIAVESTAGNPFLQKIHTKLSGGVVDKFETAFASLGAIADERLRLTSTLAVLKSTAGIEAEALIQGYVARQQRIESEAQQFTAMVAGQRKTEIDDKQAQVVGIDAQIQALSVQRQAIASTIEEAKGKLTRSQVSFDSAVNTIRAEIESALEKLKGLS